MYDIYFGKTFKKNFKKIDPILQRLVLDKINILKDNPDHPSLRTELLYKGVWASSVNMGIRIIWRLNGNTVRMINVGKHDIYKQYKNKRKRKSAFRENQ
jgi:mRNA-degrading endonuclease RelE of RelBE toxin-antitoxin system